MMIHQMKLPLRCSWVLDYTWFWLTITVLNICLSDACLRTAWGIGQLVIIEAVFEYGWLHKEKLYLTLFADEISKDKQEKPEFVVYYSFSLYAQMFVFAFVMQGILGKDIVWEAVSHRNVLDIWSNTFFMYLMLDLTSNTMHVYYHRWPGLYKLVHKDHHTARKEATSFNYYIFSEWEEVVHLVVMYSATMICAACRHHQQNFHILAFIIVRQQGMRNHSANPYSPFLFNPLLDCVFKSTIAHSNHHVDSQRNFYEFPYHHLLFGYKDDLEFYNTQFNTNIRFPYFVI
jgi:hypothetical protein